ncbi:MAG: GGDEF domain-containing protein [Phycisphaerales bacterium]|nr:GGDEF domain-containing protein [Phycisphaerales bacterium]
MSIALDVVNLIDCLPTQIVVVDALGTIQVTNRSWRRFAVENSGDPGHLCEGVNYFDICQKAATDNVEEAIQAIEGFHDVIQEKCTQFEMIYPCHAPTTRRWFQLRFVPYGDGSLFVMTHENITKKYCAERKLRKLAYADPLTGLLNRRSILRKLSKVTGDLRPVDELCVTVIDVDHFKNINDTHGHQVGDHALRAISSRIEACLRSEDMLGRIGGEEFLAILPRSSQENGVDIAERIRQSVAMHPFHVDSTQIPLSVTLGVAHCRGKAAPNELIKSADAALYQGKRAGRNQVVPCSAKKIGAIAGTLTPAGSRKRRTNRDLASERLSEASLLKRLMSH